MRPNPLTHSIVLFSLNFSVLRPMEPPTGSKAIATWRLMLQVTWPATLSSSRGKQCLKLLFLSNYFTNFFLSLPELLRILWRRSRSSSKRRTSATGRGRSGGQSRVLGLAPGRDRDAQNLLVSGPDPAAVPRLEGAPGRIHRAVAGVARLHALAAAHDPDHLPAGDRLVPGVSVTATTTDRLLMDPPEGA